MSEEKIVSNESMAMNVAKGSNLWGWFNPITINKRGIGMWAWVFQRLTGLGIVGYLYLHFFTLSSLLQGYNAYEEHAHFYASIALFQFMIWGLFVIIIYHGLNGLRVILLDLGISINAHKIIFWIFMVIGVILAALSAYLLYTIPDIQKLM